MGASRHLQLHYASTSKISATVRSARAPTTGIFRVKQCPPSKSRATGSPPRCSPSPPPGSPPCARRALSTRQTNPGRPASQRATAGASLKRQPARLTCCNAVKSATGITTQLPPSKTTADARAGGRNARRRRQWPTAIAITTHARARGGQRDHTGEPFRQPAHDRNWHPVVPERGARVRNRCRDRHVAAEKRVCGQRRIQEATARPPPFVEPALVPIIGCLDARSYRPVVRAD